MIILALSALFSVAHSRLLVGNTLVAAAKNNSLVEDEALFPGTTLDPKTYQFRDNFHRDEHLVKNLPGLPADYKHKMYAGHVKVQEKRLNNPGAVFYWLLESQSDPKKDPVLIWLNGGPGCSSMEGLFGENGPFWLSKDGESLNLNEFSWNKHANVLYIDQPVGTGLAVALRGHYAHNQDEVDTMFATFLHRWYAAYPEYRSRELWFSGESYAGHYIPSFATGLRQGRGAFKGLQDIKIGGLMIGNGWSHPLIQTQTWPEFAYNMGLVGWQQRHYLEKLSFECGQAFANDPRINPNPVVRDNHTAPWNDEAEMVSQSEHKGRKETPEERFLRKTIIRAEDRLRSGGDDNPKRLRSAPLSVPECNKIFEDLLMLSGSASSGLINVYDVRLYDTSAGDAWPPSTGPMKKYLNNAKVRRAINAVELYEWNECSGPVNRYLGDDNMIASRPLIAEIMDKWHVPVLLYNGQFDFICNHVGTEAYLSTMRIYKDLEKFLSSKRAIWIVDGEIAGYVKHGLGTKLTFLLVLGGSHMAPMDKPKQTYDMIRRFMDGKKFDDEATLISVPFTATIPYIPGDVVNASYPHHHDSHHPHAGLAEEDLANPTSFFNFHSSTPFTSLLFFSVMLSLFGLFALSAYHLLNCVKHKTKRYEYETLE